MILDVIRASRTISRVELAAATGLTQATVSNVVRRLLEDGFVVEDGRGASTGGKPRTLLRIDICGSGGFALSAGATSMPATPRPWPPSAANEPASAPKKATAGADPEPRSSRRSDPASVHGQRARRTNGDDRDCSAQIPGEIIATYRRLEVEGDDQRRSWPT
jgi:hypothetical protein